MMYRWPGKSGQLYTYQIYELPHNFKAMPGNYIFVKGIGPTRWIPIYIGESTDLLAPFDHHHAMPWIDEYAATHIHAHANFGGRADRQAEEQDLIARWSPPCNR